MNMIVEYNTVIQYHISIGSGPPLILIKIYFYKKIFRIFTTVFEGVRGELYYKNYSTSRGVGRHMVDFTSRLLDPQCVCGQTLLRSDQSGNDSENFAVTLSL